MYDEMSVMYGQLDAYKHSGSRLDRSTLLELYNGGSWSRHFKNKDNSTSKMKHTSFNMCGFIQPAYIVNMLESTDIDAFNDRQFFVCPEEMECMYHDLKVPMDSEVPKLEKIFKIVSEAHDRKVNYTFNGAAKLVFIEAHDDLCVRKSHIQDDEDRRGILSKGKGQLVRLAMVIHALEQAISHAMLGETTWSDKIDEITISKAKNVLDYLIDEKFALMKPEIKIVEDADISSDQIGSQLLDNSKHVTKFLSFNRSEITASDVSQYRLMPATKTSDKNKYPAKECKSYMKRVADAGFGIVREIEREGSFRKCATFYKRQLQDLGIPQRESLKKLKISDEQYNSSFSSSSDDSFMNTTDSQIGDSDSPVLLTTPAD
jgi:hypothetical protein